MTERLQLSNGSGQQAAPRESPPSGGSDVVVRRTLPPLPPPRVEPTILGFPAEESDDEEDDDPYPSAAGVPARGPDVVGRLVFLRRADGLAGVLLVLAGIAAAVSLLLPWTADGTSGLTLVIRGVDVLASGVDQLARSDLWQPLTVLVCGIALFLLGLRLFHPARAHRPVGVLALLIAMPAAAAVLLLVAGVDWRIDRFGLGLWFVVAVPALGLLGALKAMLTAPRVRIGPS